MTEKNIKNFCIIAHIDHGKSTLADRLLEITGTIEKRDLRSQTLDTMDLEQERWITIKLTPVRMNRKWHELNMIDTPGHVDFQYEVSRSLASVEWCLLVVDATQGIEAQTLSNVYLALEYDLDIIPVINKIDLPAADVPAVTAEIVGLLGCNADDIIPVSAKTGEWVADILDRILEKVSPPKVIPSNLKESDQELKALVFDSQYDSYRGVVSYVKVFSGEICKWDTLHFLHTHKKIEALDVGYFSPKYTSDKKIVAGSIGYIVTGLKSIRDAQVWDTVWKAENIPGPKAKPETAKPIEWFQKVTPFIYAGVFPMDTAEYPVFKDAFEKLILNDSALQIEPEVSGALGHGYRCGFLGLLHLDIVKERFFREFSIDVIVTSPQVTYEIEIPGDKTSQYSRFSPIFSSERKLTTIKISNPQDLPARELYTTIREPVSKCEIITPSEYIGPLMQLAQDRRGVFQNQSYIDQNRVMMTYFLPTNELIGDFYDELKSLSSGYASMNYEFAHYSEDDLVKLEILIAGEKIDALALICHRSQAAYLWGKMTKKLKEIVPRALFTIALQASVGGKVVAREDISALRKDVTAKLYGGDITRKRKLLEKQKEGKKKMKQFGRVSLPSEAFVNLLKK